MDSGKYIIVKCRGHEVAIVFSPLINHCDIGTKGESEGKVVSAGSFEVYSHPTEDDPNDIDVAVWGQSITLKVSKRRREDPEIIRKMLRPQQTY